MNAMKKLLAMLLALCMMLSFAACSDTADNVGETENNDTTASTEASSEAETTEETADPNLVTYTVHVVDEAGNPITSGMIQFCLDSCSPVVIDGNGTAVFTTNTPADYEVKFLSMPEGYTYSTEEEVFHFAEGELEMTIVLKSAT